MDYKENKNLLHKNITIGILIGLVITNTFWAATSKYSGPFIALIFYLIITYFCWRKSHFQAGIIGGIIGLVIHIYEFIFQGTMALGKLESGFFFMNLIFPIPLIYFSFIAYQKIQSRRD